MSHAEQLVELIVPARERPHVARALLAAARGLGLQPTIVAATSYGYRVPQPVAEAADKLLATDQPDGLLVFVASPPGGRVGYGHDQAEPEPEVEAELPEPVRNRRRGSRK